MRECLDAYVHHDHITVSKYDIHTVACVLKRFLTRLKEPLIPLNMRAKFIVAGSDFYSFLY